MAYQELIKNFENIRVYMRDFYIYGFRSRNEFQQKSGRSYDNERRRIESYLGDYMRFIHTPEGKQVFVSIDSRHTNQNPLYQAWKAKSFTNIDITLHFILLDILHSPDMGYSIADIIELMDQCYLSFFPQPLMIDASTIRNKLKEYTQLGLLSCVKQGKQLIYSRMETMDLSSWEDAISFFSEVGMDGVIGSYLLDYMKKENTMFTFKHHYITSALDSDILCTLLCAIQDQKEVSLHHIKSPATYRINVIPLKIFVSTQSGRVYLLGYHKRYLRIKSFRLDTIDHIKTMETAAEFEALKAQLTQMQQHMWGVCCKGSDESLEHVQFTIRFEDYETYIYQRMLREARCGVVERLDANSCRFSADVYDTMELLPWIRTFICRITQLDFSNRSVENQLKQDIQAMMDLYGIGDDTHAVS